MTDRYAVIGNPIGHSKSPFIHTAFAEQTGQDIAYTAMLAEPGGFAAAVDAFRAAGGRGLNITTPFKLDAFAYSTAVSEDARLAGAVNCLSFAGPAASGDNFDGVGVVRDIEHNLGLPVHGLRVLLMGAGGAARGALLPLLAARPAELVLVNRTEVKAAALVDGAGVVDQVRISGYPGLDHAGFDVVVNATSSSLTGALPPLRPDIFRGRCRLAYDMTYAKGLTPFLRLAKDCGTGRLADGVGMLVEQAAEAFALWRGVRPDTAPVIARLTVPLA